MGTIDAQGIYKYASNDVVAPLETALNVGQQSVSDVFGSLGPGTIRYVANASARNALAASYTPTATKPLYIYQGDAPVGENIQFTFNGSTWHTIRDTRYVTPSNDTGWISLSRVSGVSGELRYRKVADLVEVQASVTGSFPVGATQINTTILPPEICPSGNRRGGLGMNGSVDGSLGVSATGIVFIIQSTGATRTAADGSCLYYLG